MAAHQKETASAAFSRASRALREAQAQIEGGLFALLLDQSPAQVKQRAKEAAASLTEAKRALRDLST